jgi:hypothetical protein
MPVRPIRLSPLFSVLVLAACASEPPPTPVAPTPPPPQEFKCPPGATWDGSTCKAQHACEVEQPASAVAAQQSSACIGEADCEKQCTDGTSRSCADLANKLEKKGGTSERTNELYKKACFGGDGEGCYKLADAYQYGRGGVEKDVARMIELYGQACNCRNAGGCNDLGYHVERGEGTPKDEKRAAELYQKSCELGSALGCKNSGVLFDSGTGVAKDPAKALEYYNRACEAKQDGGCYNAGLAYERMSPPEHSKANDRYKRACERGHGAACTNYGFNVEKGHGATADNAAAYELYKKGCDNGNHYGCSNMGVMWEYGLGTGRKDTGRATEHYEKACKMGLAEGCQKMRNVISHLKSECDAQVSAKPPKPTFGPKPAATPPPNEGCTNLGYLYERGVGVSKDERTAAEFYKKSCDAKLPVGCVNLGNFYDNGKVFPQDVKKSAELYKKGCDFGASSGCNNLGVAYDSGSGVIKNERRALDLFKGACEKGNETACNNARHVTNRLAARAQKGAEFPVGAIRAQGSLGSGSGSSEALRPVTAPR